MREGRVVALSFGLTLVPPRSRSCRGPCARETPDAATPPQQSASALDSTTTDLQ